MRGRALAALALACVLLLPGAAGAEVRAVEAVGAVPLDPDSPPRRSPRDIAVQRALSDAVWRVALDEAPELDPEARGEQLAAALGDDPLDYATRFRIVEDRGERPALFNEIPGVETEYVVVVEVHVDSDRVRDRLVQSGLLRTSAGDGRRYRVRVVVEDVGSWASYRAVRTLLEDIGVHSAVPVEMVKGRAVLDVVGERSPDELMAALVRAAPPNLRLVPVGTDGDTLRLRARFLGTPAAPGPGAPHD